MAQPRIGHLQQALNIFYYLTHNIKRGWLVYDPYDFEINWKPMRPNEVPPEERAKAMRDIYYEAEDPEPHGMPQPLGKSVNINCFVDSDHAGNKVTRRSHTGIMIYINMSPIIWYSKRQNTVESSTFGAELVAMRIATEMIEALRYKLKMLGVPLAGPARVMCDNQSVVISSSFPETTLKKKHCSIAYHRIREAVASNKLLIYFEYSVSNVADLFTKVLPANERHPLIQSVLS